MYNKIKQSSFLKNTLLLISGTTLAQAIPMLISPILTRLYSAESFGIFMVYMSFISILGVIGTARYEKAVIIPKEDKKGVHLTALSQTLLFFFCILLAVLNLLFGAKILTLLSAEALIPYSWLLIIGLLFFSSDQTYYHWANRVSAYKTMSVSKVSSNLVSGISALVFGLLNWQVYGLIVSKIFGLLTSTLTNFRALSLAKLQVIQAADLKKIAKEYINFPKFILPGHLLNAVALNGPPIVFAIFYSETEVGYFALTQRVVMLPVSIIARSVGDVFRQKATEMYNATGNIRSIYLKTLGALSILGLIPFSALIFFAPFLFRLVFGADWEVSGMYAQILAILFLLQFITSPLTNVFIITGKQKLELFWQILFLIGSIAPIVIGYYLFDNMYYSLILFAAGRAIVYLLSLFLTLPITVKK